MLGERVALANPLDFHTYVWGDPEAIQERQAMVRGPADLNLLFADLPRADRCADDDWQRAITALRGLTAAVHAAPWSRRWPATCAGPGPAGWVQRGVPVLAPPGVAMEAVQAAATIGRAWAGPPAQPVARPAGLRAEPPQESPAAVRLLDEAEGKALLRRHGVPVPDGEVCASGAAAVRAAARINEPVAVKGRGAAHKTDQRAVGLGLARRAAGPRRRGRTCFPGSRRCWSSGW